MRDDNTAKDAREQLARVLNTMLDSGEQPNSGALAYAVTDALLAAGCVTHTATEWAVRRPDGHVLPRTLSMVSDGHAWSEDEAREFVARPAFAGWSLVSRERTVTCTPWRVISPAPGGTDG